MEQQRDYTEIDLREIFQIIWKRKALILLITLVAVLTSAIVSFFIVTPKYQASTEILVNQATVDRQFNQGDIRTNVELINTYSVIVKSPRILDLVIQEQNLDLTYKELNDKINVAAVRNSQVMSITVTDPDYTQAVLIANAVAKTFQREVINLMNIDNVHIMAEAKSDVVPAPVSPRKSLNVAIAFVVGLMSAIGLVFLIEYLDTSIKTEQDIEGELGLPVLASISTIVDEADQRPKRNVRANIEGGQQINA